MSTEKLTLKEHAIDAGIEGVSVSLIFLLVSWLIGYISQGWLYPSLDIAGLVDSILANQLTEAVATGVGIILLGGIIKLTRLLREYLGI